MPLARFNRWVNQGGTVLLKTGADNGVSIRFKGEGQPVRRAGSPAGVARCHSAVEAELGYNAKLQDCQNFVFEKVPRARTMRLTGYAAHILRESAAVLEREFGKNVLFITVTLPGSTREALATLANESRGVLNAFMQCFRDAVDKKNSESAPTTNFSSGGEPSLHFAGHGTAGGAPNQWLACAVWEYQKRGALHLHLVVGVADPALQAVFQQSAKRWWIKTLRHYSKKTGVDLFGKKNGGSWKGAHLRYACKVEKVKKSVGRYMAKYLSKDARKFVEDGYNPPSSWWYLSEDLRALVMAERRLDAYRLVSIEEAQEQAVDIAELAQEMGGTVLVTENPFTGRACGYQVYFDNGRKQEFYEYAVIYLRAKHGTQLGELKGAPPLPDDYWEQYAFQKSVNLMFDAVPLDTVAAGYADFCAPSSASEEGGGRW